MVRYRTSLATGACFVLLVFLFGRSNIPDLPPYRIRLVDVKADAQSHAKLHATNRLLQLKLEQERERLAAVRIETAQDREKSTEEEKASTDGFAYVFYATSDPYACSVLVNIHRLRHQLQTKFPIHVLASADVSKTYIEAMESASSIVHIRDVPPLAGNEGGYYADCLLKLLAFELHKLDPTLERVLAFDSDQLIMKNLDHLFTGLPEVDVAAPRAYWLARDFLTSTFLMINLSDSLWHAVKTAMDAVDYDVFDMDLINELLGDTVMMLSGEYATLNSHWEDWNLPKWFHPTSKVNMTTVELLNALAKQNRRVGMKAKRDETATLVVPGPAVTVTQLTEHNALGNTYSSDEPSATFSVETETDKATQDAIPALPRFPENHPITHELYRLQEAAAVIHFSAGKPWMYTPHAVTAMRPDAHPLLAEQFRVWRDTAAEVCPGGIPDPFSVIAESAKTSSTVRTASRSAPPEVITSSATD